MGARELGFRREVHKIKKALKMRIPWLLTCMMLFPVAAISGVAAQVPVHGQIPTWRTYVDPRNQTTVDVPVSLLVPAGNSAKGTGERYKGTDDRVSLSIYSLPNESGEVPAGYLDANLKVGRSQIQYQRIARSFFAISMERNGLIYYSRCNFVRRSAPSIHCIDLEYPQEYKRAWDPIVTRISRSLRPLEG